MAREGEAHKLKFLKAVYCMAGRGIDGGRMWVQSIESGTSYGAISKGGDIAIVNDFSRDPGDDICFHFASVNLDSIDSEMVDVSSTDSAIMLFTPSDAGSLTGVFGNCVKPIGLPSLEGIAESTSKHIVTTEQITAVNRAFDCVSASYHCIPVTLGNKAYMAFTAKGRKWDMVVMCSAKKTNESVLEALSAGWINSATTTASSTKKTNRLEWGNVPKDVKRIMAEHLGLINKRYTSKVEERLTNNDAHDVFRSLPIEVIHIIGGEMGMNDNATAAKVLKALLDHQEVEGSS